MNQYLQHMSDSPLAICPCCGAMVQVYEAGAGLYLGCPEAACSWMSTPIDLEPGDGDIEIILREIERMEQDDPSAE